MKKSFKSTAIISAFAFMLVFLTGMAQAPKRKVYIKVLKKRHYQLMVDGQPYIIKGVCYNPVPIGKTHDYDFWSDTLEPWKTDGELMKKMGINTVRFYEPGENLDSVKKVIKDLYEIYGIRTMMGNWLNFWNYPAPFYDDKNFREKVKRDVLEMVEALKNEEGILCWVLGNENNYSFSGKVNSWSSERIDKIGNPRQCMLARAEAYYSLVDEIAREIHRVDPDHPVVMGNGELVCLDIAAKYAKHVDAIGCIIYRGKTFGNLFHSIRNTFDKPVILIEFGADAYNAYTKEEDDDMQAFFLKSQWSEIYKNLGNNDDGAGNCLGGAMFEWNDEWWKHNDYSQAGWSAHDTESNWSNGSYYMDIKAERNMNMNEEWFGLVKLEKQSSGLDKRIPRKAYFVIREFWKNPKE